jgi:hypothetical protein
MTLKLVGENSKVLSLSGLVGLYGCEMLRISHCVDNLLTDGGKVSQLYASATLYSPETLFVCFWYPFLLEAEYTSGPSVAGRIRQIGGGKN